MNATICHSLKIKLSAIAMAVLFVGTALLPTDTFARNVNVNRNVNRNVNNRNVNVNRNVNRNVNVNAGRHVDVDVHHGYGHGYHPVATAAAVTATVAVTAAVVGSIVNTVPPSCSTVQIGTVVYQQCGSTWYQPQYYGSSVQYIVVNPPR